MVDTVVATEVVLEVDVRGVPLPFNDDSSSSSSSSPPLPSSSCSVLVLPGYQSGIQCMIRYQVRVRTVALSLTQ